MNVIVPLFPSLLKDADAKTSTGDDLDFQGRSGYPGADEMNGLLETQDGGPEAVDRVEGGQDAPEGVIEGTSTNKQGAVDGSIPLEASDGLPVVASVERDATVASVEREATVTKKTVEQLPKVPKVASKPSVDIKEDHDVKEKKSKTSLKKEAKVVVEKKSKTSLKKEAKVVVVSPASTEAKVAESVEPKRAKTKKSRSVKRTKNEGEEEHQRKHRIRKASSAKRESKGEEGERTKKKRGDKDKLEVSDEEKRSLKQTKGRAKEERRNKVVEDKKKAMKASPEVIEHKSHRESMKPGVHKERKQTEVKSAGEVKRRDIHHHGRQERDAQHTAKGKRKVSIESSDATATDTSTAPAVRHHHHHYRHHHHRHHRRHRETYDERTVTRGGQSKSGDDRRRRSKDVKQKSGSRGNLQQDDPRKHPAHLLTHPFDLAEQDIRKTQEMGRRKSHERRRTLERGGGPNGGGSGGIHKISLLSHLALCIVCIACLLLIGYRRTVTQYEVWPNFPGVIWFAGCFCISILKLYVHGIRTRNSFIKASSQIVGWAVVVTLFPMLIGMVFGKYGYYRLIPLALLIILPPHTILNFTTVMESLPNTTLNCCLLCLWAMFITGFDMWNPYFIITPPLWTIALFTIGKSNRIFMNGNVKMRDIYYGILCLITTMLLLGLLYHGPKYDQMFGTDTVGAYNRMMCERSAEPRLFQGYQPTIRSPKDFGEVADEDCCKEVNAAGRVQEKKKEEKTEEQKEEYVGTPEACRQLEEMKKKLGKKKKCKRKTVEVKKRTCDFDEDARPSKDQGWGMVRHVGSVELPVIPTWT
ncbi:unnamed protein product [Cyprideis torosa]|uniref:Uncharacterized protein n=1 Tax=Cyprideis torosa TaxID=163714 RepID=A0A7R8WEF0_9CRUS|nr:unnamed protein product [Cyprideis torosa]CAG0895708.1 unnamed protein product [Cyprideis torosa]